MRICGNICTNNIIRENASFALYLYTVYEKAARQAINSVKKVETTDSIMLLNRYCPIFISVKTFFRKYGEKSCGKSDGGIEIIDSGLCNAEITSQ